ncbi:MAG: Hsp20 family protein [Alphaproteobacteria bacterium]|nr:Hsp20 family protein [Alphaproteobacteria bacterium]
MRTTLDFSPLYRSSVGFDRVFDLLETASRIETIDNWPPYDIARTGDDAYRITMVVAGFSQDELSLTHEPNMLVVSGSKSGDEKTEYLHRGIAGRPFQRRFELADHVKVARANLENGLLTIDLQREIPEEMKPRRIEIATGPGLSKSEPRQIGAEKQAA